MNSCRKCVIPDTRPDTEFVDGVCSACRNYETRPTINWDQRLSELHDLISIGNNSTEFDMIVPSSGGKDSHWQVLKLIELGYRPLVVTSSTCHLTTIGRYNISNLAKYATTIEVTPNRDVRAKLNRLGLEMVGDISWPENASIFSVPFRMSVALGIPLIFYGESPQREYGGPPTTAENRQMTRRWVSEFGGFLGIRPVDFVDMEGIKYEDMKDYMLPTDEEMNRVGTQAHFLGQYIEFSGWKPGEALYDPMCGSGTYLMEAAQMALDIAPGSGARLRLSERMLRMDAKVWVRMKAEAQAACQPVRPLPIYGSDVMGSSLRDADSNLKAAGLREAVSLSKVDILGIEPPAESGVLVMNPPYGVRLGEEEELAVLYPKLGDVLKNRFANWRAYIISADASLPRLIRLSASKKTPLFNGALECRVYEYKLVEGSNR